jgi:hypothetical protein
MKLKKRQKGFFDGFGFGDLLDTGLGLLGFKEQKDINRQNQSNYETNLAFQRETAQNAHQWQVADMRKAGLNPILSATGGRGASPGGGSNLPDIRSKVTNALQLKRLNAETKNIEADAKLKQEQAKLTQSQTGKTDVETFGLSYKQRERIDQKLNMMFSDEQQTISATDLNRQKQDNVKAQTQLLYEVTLPNGLLDQQKTLYLSEEMEMKFKFLRGEYGQTVINMEQAGRAGTAVGVGLGIGAASFGLLGSLLGRIAKKSFGNKKVQQKIGELFKNAPPSVRKSMSKYMDMRELKKLLGD